MSWRSRFENFELHGRWWEPDADDEKIGGLLSYDPEQGLTLKVTGRFPGEPEPEINGPGLRGFQPDFLFGVTDEGPATLLNVRVVGYRHPGPEGAEGHVERTLWAEKCLLGGHSTVDDIENIQKTVFSFTHFEEWLELSPFNSRHGREDDNFDHRIDWIRRDEEIAYIEEIGADIRVLHSWGTERMGPPRKTEVESRLLIFIEPDAPEDLSYFQERGQDIATLVGLCSDTPTYIDHAFIPPIIEDGTIERPEMEIISPPGKANHPRKPPAETPYSPQPEGPSPDLDTLLQTWFSVLEWAEDSADLFATIQRDGDLLPKVRLLLLTQALESWHRGSEDGQYTDPESYEDIRNHLVESIPTEVDESHRAALKAKIRYGNEYSLRKRFKELMERLEPPVRDEIVEDQGAFVDQVVNTRNYYTHYDEEIERIDRGDLPLYVYRTRLFLQSLMLRELGIGPFEFHGWLSRWA